MAYGYNKQTQVIGDSIAADDPERNTKIEFGNDKIDFYVSGSQKLIIEPSNIIISGNIDVSNVTNINSLSVNVRVKNFTPSINTDTTTDSDFLLLYGTLTNAGTITLHQPNSNGRMLIIRKISDSLNLFITCSSGLILSNINNLNVNSITMSSGINTNRYFVYNNNIWHELFARYLIFMVFYEKLYYLFLITNEQYNTNHPSKPRRCWISFVRNPPQKT